MKPLCSGNQTRASENAGILNIDICFISLDAMEGLITDVSNY